jgi:hypothetical protein
MLKKIVEKIKTHIIMFNNFLKKNHAIYEIKCKNAVQQGRPQITMWHMQIACWITKAKNTHSQYVICVAVPLQQRLKEHASMLHYMYTASLVNDHFT